MHPFFPWMSVCIYRTSVNALTLLALFTLKAASWKHFFKDIFLKDPWLLYAMDPFWLSPCVLIALDLLLYLFVCVTIHISVRLRSGNSAYAPEGCAFWRISRIYQHYRWSLSLYINVQDLPLPPNNPTSSTVSMMHQQSATPHYSSAQAGGQHYQGQQAMGMMGQGSQGNSMMSQRPMGSYRSSQQGRWQDFFTLLWYGCCFSEFIWTDLCTYVHLCGCVCEHLNVWRIVFQVFQVWRWLPVSKFWDGLRWKP